MSINIASRIRATGEKVGCGNVKNVLPIAKVKCQGCGKEIRSDGDLSSVEYVRTRRGTELFFHRSCVDKVWKHGMV